jgi:DNA-binding LytR/AlgR family response regulator
MENAIVALNAILLDDDYNARINAKKIFEAHEINLEVFDNISEFLTQAENFDIILCDLDLKNIASTQNGIEVLDLARKRNKSAFIGIYTAFDTKITESQKIELTENDITIYSKNDPSSSIKRLKREYQTHHNNNQPSDIDYKIDHYAFNKKITLEHLNNISNKKLDIPIVKLNKSFTYSQLIDKIKNDTTEGNLFILEFMENISLLNKYIKK